MFLVLPATGFGWSSAIGRVSASAGRMLLGGLMWPVLGVGRRIRGDDRAGW